MLARCVLATVVWLLWQGVSVADPSWRAGASKVTITPPEPMWMSGYANRNKPAEGKIHELWVKALALEDPAGERALLLTLDLVGIDRALASAICADLAAEHKLPRQAIVLATSHTHSGPVVRGNLTTMYDLDVTQAALVEKYGDLLKKRAGEAARQALANLQTARLQVAVGHCSFAVNRRNNKEKEVPGLRDAGRLVGPVDHDVPVLAVYDRQDRLMAVAMGYACHATVLDGYQWCGDYPGFAQEILEKRHPGAVALFWAGCGGDQNPLPRRSLPLAEQYGRDLADAVDGVLRGAMTPVVGPLACSYREIDLPFSDIPRREQFVIDAASKNRFIANRAKMLLKELEKQGELRGNYPYPVQAWQMGDQVTWVFLGGEVVVDYALKVKQALAPRTTWVAGYCNDVMAYIPSLRVLREGGYEGREAMIYYGLPTAWSPRVEDLILEEALSQARRLQR